MKETIHDHVIHKHSIAAQVNRIRMAKGAEILSVQCQKSEIVLWEKHDFESTETEERDIRIFATGESFYAQSRRELKYIGTVQVGLTVWHVFESVKNLVEKGNASGAS